MGDDAMTLIAPGRPGAAAEMLPAPVLRVSGLHVYYGALHVLRGVSLDVPRATILAIIGPSGCGKSSLLRALNRMNDRIPDHRVEGRVRLDGQDIYTRGVDVVALRRRIGMVFQKPIPFPMSVYDNVAYGPRLHRLVRSRGDLDVVVEASLRQSGLWDEVKDRLGVPAAELSGGQQQRLCIARALAVKPDVLLMDEPASALDPASTLKIEALARTLRETLTIVIVTHNMQQAARVSDSTAFMLAGEIVEYGPTAEIFTRPRDRRTEDYITGRFG
jgi:phosphate transport system ATP-binding protein